MSTSASELVATYSALGTRDGDEYFRGDECLACVKDLIRALRSDSDRCEIRIHLGKAQVLQKDLMALLVHYADDTRLRNDVIRLLVNLTQPAYLCLGEQYPGSRDTDGMKCMMEVNRHLREYKEEFAVERVMNTLGTVLAELCQKDWDDRDDDDVIIIERILLLIRNVLHISPAPEEEKRTDDDVSLHDQVIWNLHINGIDELLLFLGSNPNETEWCMHILEIVFLFLRQQSPSNLAQVGRSHTHQEKKKEEERIEELLVRENTERHKRNIQRGTRHSNFGGSYVVTEQLTISGKGRVHHKPLAAVNSYSQDVEKRPRRTPKNKKIAPDPPKERLSTYSIRLVLKEFCIQLLECCFNVLMRVVKDNINRMKAMDNDETYYLWAMRFFMEFSRLHNFRVDIVSETLQLPTLHYVLQLMVGYYENMVMHKRERQDALAWSQRLHYAVQSYKELLTYIQTMTKSHDDSIVESSKVILSNILYQPEYREIFVTLLRNHYEMFQPMRFVHDVIEMTHTYLSLMEHYCKTNGGLLIQKRRKVSKKRKKSFVEVTEVLTEEQVLAKWEEVREELESVLMRAEFNDELPVPFDPLSDKSGDEQKQVAMTNVYKMLCNGRPSTAIAWIRASREMWPDDVFGSDGMTSSQELETLRELLMNPLSSVPLTRQVEEQQHRQDDEEEETESQEPIFRSYELEFDIKKYTEQFANNKIVRVYSLALAGFRDNTDQLNHAIVKMLHRIAVRHNMVAMLFQVSVFRILSTVLNELPLPRYKELQTFCRHIVSRFFTMAHKNPLLFAELLVWKTSRSCYELTMGYGTLERERERHRNRAVWTREQEDELRALYEEFKNETDIVGCIEAALPSEHLRTRKIIASQLVSMGIVESRQTLNKKKKKGVWSEEDVFTLQSVFHYQENEKEAVQQVAQYFPGRSLRDIRQQLETIGLLAASSTRRRATRSPDSDMDPDSIIEELTATNQYTTARSVQRLVQSLHHDGLTEQLSWLETYLSDEAQDREVDDEWEEMCIVAMEKQVSDALNRQDFKDLMGSLGLTPPNAQEVYWRIPATMCPATLREMVAKLQHKEERQASPTVERRDEMETDPAMRRLEDGSDDDGDHRLSIVASDIYDDQLSDHSDHSFHHSVNSDYHNSDEELSKDGALAMLRKRRRRRDDSHSLPHKVTAKKPRLATRSQFLSDQSDDESDMDDCSSQQSREDVGVRHGRITRLDSNSDDDEGLVVDESNCGHDDSQAVRSDADCDEMNTNELLEESSFHLAVTETIDTENQ